MFHVILIIFKWLFAEVIIYFYFYVFDIFLQHA